MAWQLGSSQTTSTLANYATKISKSDLKAGDILLNGGDHVLIFSSWVDSGKTKYEAYKYQIKI
jgi:hypothetical protein